MNKTTTIPLFLLLLLAVTHQQQILASGIRLAGKLLGLDESSGIAQLVSEAFGKTDTQSKKGDDGSVPGQQNNIFSGFLRILGFDAKKIGAIAVNAIIFVAQLVKKKTMIKM